MKLVKVARVGNKVIEVALSDDAKVGDALNAAGLAVRCGEIIFLNHVAVHDFNTMVPASSSIILEKEKIDPALVKLLDALADLDVLDYDDYYDENDDKVDYRGIYEDRKSEIDNLIKISREVK
jgi:hypothetical protein